MPPETPKFWQDDNWLSCFLIPLSALYLVIHRLKSWLSRPYTSSMPVICIGGIMAGGSGKTPTLHAFVDLIRAKGLYQKPVILLRGYGGKIRKATLVDLSVHTYKDVGDEALLHAATAPTIVAANRADGARLAETMGADIILMDDGLQNTSLIKTASVFVVDAKQGFGNKRLLPAGPLREPIQDALKKVDAVVCIGDAADIVPAGKPVLMASIITTMLPQPGTDYVAFAGLGRPEKFRATLMAQGFPVSDFIPFPDHHPYNDNDMKKLAFLAEGKTLITTAKDFVRIPAPYREMIKVLPVSLKFADPDAAARLLKAAS